MRGTENEGRKEGRRVGRGERGERERSRKDGGKEIGRSGREVVKGVGRREREGKE